MLKRDTGTVAWADRVANRWVSVLGRDLLWQPFPRALRDSDLAQRIRRLSNYGFESGSIARAGTNAKLSEYAAAVGLAQLDRADAVMERRIRLCVPREST